MYIWMSNKPSRDHANKSWRLLPDKKPKQLLP